MKQRRDKAAEDRKGKIMLASVGGFIGLITVAWLIFGRVAVDPLTLCVMNQPLAERVVLLIDQTDPMSAVQIQSLLAKIRHIKEVELKKNGMLTIFLIGDYDSGYLKKVFCLCNPGREANPIFQNQRMIQTRCDSLFGKPLDDALKELATAVTADRSPLFEAIRQVSELSDFAPGPPRKLIVVSDLLQNSSAFSVYRERPDFSLLSGSHAYTDLRADLKGAQIEEIRVPRKRDQALLRPELFRLWERYFTDCGSQLLPVDML